MSMQQDAVIRIVDEQHQQGRKVGEVLATLGIKRATYYRWKKGRD
ncbi:MAG: transposase [Nitrospira sp.]|nr:transposase [Nitrospira sp.]